MKVTQALSVTLTRRRIIEVALKNRWQTPQEMLRFWDLYPFPETNEKLFRDSWQELVEWYRKEAEAQDTQSP